MRFLNVTLGEYEVTYIFDSTTNEFIIKVNSITIRRTPEKLIECSVGNCVINSSQDNYEVIIGYDKVEVNKSFIKVGTDDHDVVFTDEDITLRSSHHDVIIERHGENIKLEIIDNSLYKVIHASTETNPKSLSESTVMNQNLQYKIDKYTT